jgi:hypothetical protein
MTINARLENAQRMQDMVVQAVEALNARGVAERVKGTTLRLHRYAVRVTHKDTTALSRSHIPRVQGLHGEIYINPAARNPKRGRPAVYGPYEHRRGGAHAFYDRTVREHGEVSANAELRILVESLP